MPTRCCSSSSAVISPAERFIAAAVARETAEAADDLLPPIIDQVLRFVRGGMEALAADGE